MTDYSRPDLSLVLNLHMCIHTHGFECVETHMQTQIRTGCVGTLERFKDTGSAKKDRKRLWMAVPNKIDCTLKIYKRAVASLLFFSNYLSPFTTVVTSVEGLGQGYLIVLIFVGDLERLRGSDHGLHGCEDVLVDEFGEAPFILIGVAGTVDNPHLFDECALPALPSA